MVHSNTHTHTYNVCHTFVYLMEYFILTKWLRMFAFWRWWRWRPMQIVLDWKIQMRTHCVFVSANLSIRVSLCVTHTHARTAYAVCIWSDYLYPKHANFGIFVMITSANKSNEIMIALEMMEKRKEKHTRRAHTAGKRGEETDFFSLAFCTVRCVDERVFLWRVKEMCVCDAKHLIFVCLIFFSTNPNDFVRQSLNISVCEIIEKCFCSLHLLC